MKKNSIQKIVLSGFFLALCLVLPFLTMQIPGLGSRLLPMHIPVLICGFVCGWPFGLIVGLIAPVFRSMLFGMPPMFPTAVAMTFELATYGLVAGLLYRALPKKSVYIIVTLITAMICGRIVWGAASMLFYGIQGNAFTWSIFLNGAVIYAIPGIIVQLVLIPAIIVALYRMKYIPDHV